MYLFSAGLASLAPFISPNWPASPAGWAPLSLLSLSLFRHRKEISHATATMKGIPRPTPTPIAIFAFFSIPFCTVDCVGEEVEDELLDDAVVEVVEAVDMAFAVEEVEAIEAVEAELAVEEAVAATTNVSPNAIAPVESVIARKNFFPGTANIPGVHK